MKAYILCSVVILSALLGCRTAQVNGASPGPKEFVAVEADYREYEAVVKNCMAFGSSRAECEDDTSNNVCRASWSKGYCGRHLRQTQHLDKFMD